MFINYKAMSCQVPEVTGEVFCLCLSLASHFCCVFLVCHLTCASGGNL